MENKIKEISKRITALALTGVLATGSYALAENKNKYSGRSVNRTRVTTNVTKELSTKDDFASLLENYRDESTSFDINSVAEVSKIVEKIYSQLKENKTISVSKESILAWIVIFNDKNLEDYSLDSSKFMVYMQEFFQAVNTGVLDIANSKLLQSPIKANKTIVNFEELFANSEERKAVKLFSDARNSIIESANNKDLDEKIIAANRVAYEYLMLDKKFELDNSDVTLYSNLGYGAQTAIAMISIANNTVFYDLSFKDLNGDIIDSQYLDEEVLTPAYKQGYNNLKQQCKIQTKTK